MFQRIDDRFNLEVASFGSNNDRVLVFRVPGGADEWEKIEGTRTLLIGGEAAKKELKRLLNSRADGLGRPALQDRVPGGMNSRTHTAMRKFVDF